MQHWGGYLCAGALLVLTLNMCGGSQDTSCVSGTSVACGGPGGCSGYQLCNAAGSYDSCVCGDGGSSPDATVDGPTGDAGALDVGPDSPADASGTWTPKSLPGLSLWLDDTAGLVEDSQNAGYIKHWLDQSGNGNDAAGGCNGSCGEPGYDQAAIHGHDAIICTGAMEITDAPSLQFGTGDFAIAMVAKIGTGGFNLPEAYYWRKFDTQTSYGIHLDVPTNSNNLLFEDFNKSITIDMTAYSGKWEIVLMQGSTMKLDIGADDYTGPTASFDVSAAGIDPIFCQVNNASVEIAEIIAVKGTLSTSDATSVHAYLATKFALP